MDGGVVINKENYNVNGAKMKGEEMAKGSAVVGNMPRKKLADVSNLPPNNRDTKLPSISLNTKDYIQKLQEENLALVKLLAERNKNLQSCAVELQKLRTQCQQLQQKNMELARSRSQILAESNSIKDRLKELQHELGCRNGLLKAMKLESEDKQNTVRCQIHGNEVETFTHGEVEKFSQAHNRDTECCNKRRKRQSKSLDHTVIKPVPTEEKIKKKRKSAKLKAREQDRTDDKFEIIEALDTHMNEPVEAEKKVGEKRLCLRRQSARLKAAEQETADSSCHISDALDPAILNPLQTGKKADNKRLCSRRQSGRFKSQEQDQETVPELSVPAVKCETEAAHCALRRQSGRFKIHEQVQDQETGPALSLAAVKCETGVAHSSAGSQAQELRRSSFRPKRQVVEKVQSYKEVPLNVKMRRPE